MITFKNKGDFSKTDKFLERAKDFFNTGVLDKYGEQGVKALQEATPKNTGKTSESWYYKTHYTKSSMSITWNNSNYNEGVPIAVIIQYGHGTSQGAYIQGIDYINPSIKPIFREIANNTWKELTNK